MIALSHKTESFHVSLLPHDNIVTVHRNRYRIVDNKVVKRGMGKIDLGHSSLTKRIKEAKRLNIKCNADH